jgi:hypothetical protein
MGPDRRRKGYPAAAAERESDKDVATESRVGARDSERVRSDAFSTRYKISANRSNAETSLHDVKVACGNYSRRDMLQCSFAENAGAPQASLQLETNGTFVVWIYHRPCGLVVRDDPSHTRRPV